MKKKCCVVIRKEYRERENRLIDSWLANEARKKRKRALSTLGKIENSLHAEENEHLFDLENTARAICEILSAGHISNGCVRKIKNKTFLIHWNQHFSRHLRIMLIYIFIACCGLFVFGLHSL